MKKRTALTFNPKLPLAALAALLIASSPARVLAKHKPQDPSANDPTPRLFQLLDTSYGGKLNDWYLLGEIYKNPSKPNEELQRVYRVEYDKAHAFGKLAIYIRAVSKLQPEQLKTYTPKMVYDFGVADLEKFVKTQPGVFGQTGDLYLQSSGERALATAPVTEEIQKEYDKIVTDELLPALQKK